MTTSLRGNDIFDESLQGKSRGKNFSGLCGRSRGPLPHALYLACTWNVPAIYLTGTAQVSALIYLAGDGGRAGLRGGLRRAGRAQVHAR
jgi:hypothetical protein